MTMPGPNSMPLRELLAPLEPASDIPDLALMGLALDSRAIKQGFVYLAVQGSVAHGLDYIDSALSSGAVAVLVDAEDTHADIAALINGKKAGVPLIRVPDLIANAGVLASQFYDHPTRHIEVCGVTGTDGKTSVCRFISESLRSLGIKTGYIGTIGWGIDDELEPNPLTTPDPVTLQRMFASLRERGATCVAIEVSSHALAQGRINGVALDVAILTNLGRDHLDYHGTLQHYRAAKEKLFHWPGLRGVVLNTDDEFGRQLQSDLGGSQTSNLKILGYSVSAKSELQSSIVASAISADARGLGFSLQVEGVVYPLRSPLLGTFNVQNLLACFGALRLLGVSANDGVNALAELKSVPGRMEHFTVDGGTNAVVDFAHTPQALEAAIKTLRHHCEGRLTVVFGCGGDRDKGKRKLMGKVASRFADQVIVTDDNPRSEASTAIIEQILSGIENGSATRVISDRGEAITEALRHAANDDWVLVAGKGHEDYQIVGNQRFDFSDRAKVVAVLESLQLKTGGAA